MKELNNLSELKEIIMTMVQARLGAFLNHVEADAVLIIRKHKLHNTGTLQASIITSVLQKDNTIDAIVGISEKAGYGKFWHEGIKPHMPPVEPLIKWINKKKIIPQSFRKLKKKGTAKTLIKHRTGMAWAIAFKMKKEGKSAIPFLRLAIMKNLKLLEKPL